MIPTATLQRLMQAAVSATPDDGETNRHMQVSVSLEDLIAALDEIDRLQQAQPPSSVHQSHLPTVIDSLEDQLATAHAEIERLRAQRDSTGCVDMPWCAVENDHDPACPANTDALRAQLTTAHGELDASRAEVAELRKSNEWNAAHAKMMARAADTERADREVFRLQAKDLKEHLSTLQSALGEACDRLEAYWDRLYTKSEQAEVGDGGVVSLRKAGQ